jgi:predicted alpha/beta hydrolase family esterase
VSSAIHAKHGVYNTKERLDQTIATCASIKAKVPNADIIILDGGHEHLTDEEKEIAKPWLETPIDFAKLKQHTKKFFAVFSDNDDVVPQENKKLFEERLGAKTAIEHDKGHFSGGDEVKELPIILEAILSQ